MTRLLASQESSHQGDPVENPELTNAAWWYWFWELIGTISFFGVVVTLAVEFGAARLAAPYREILDNAREERISTANERAAKAELELAKFRAPRRIADETAFIKAVTAAPAPTSFSVRYVKDDPDSSMFATRLFLLLSLNAHWNPTPGVFPIGPITETDAIYPPMWNIVPATQAVGAPMPTGITIISNFSDRSKGTPTIDALQDALVAELGSVIWRGENATLPDGVLVIVVAPKG
jgi:hypothetical protein